MRLTGKPNAGELKEFRQIVWEPHYYLSLANNYLWPRYFPFMGAIFIGSLLTVGIAQKFRVNPAIVGSLFGTLGAACFIGLVIRWHHLPQSALRKITADFPEIIEIDDSGLRMTQADGICTLIPWSVLKGWRSGSHTLVIDFLTGGNLLPVPLEQLSIDQQTILRDLLHRRLGDPTFSLAPKDKA